MSDSNQEPLFYQNSDVQVKVTKAPRCETTFEIILTPNAVAECSRRAFKNVKKGISIPGFRQGKAPDDLIRKDFARDLQRELVNVVLDRGFQESVRLSHLAPSEKKGAFQPPKIEQCEEGKEARFTIIFERKAEIPSIDLSTRVLDIPLEAPVTNESWQQAWHAFQVSRAKYEPIADRGVAQGDFVTVDLEILSDPPQTLAKNQRFEVNKPYIPDWLIHKIIGLKAGESYEGMTEHDPSRPDEFIQAQPFKVTIHTIEKAVFPVYNEGSDQEKQDREMIDRRVKWEAEKALFETNSQILDRYLLENYSVDVPKSVFEEALAQRLDQLRELKKNNQPTPDDNDPGVLSEIKHQVNQMLSLSFLLQSCAQEHHLVPGEGVEQEIRLTLLQAGRITIQDLFNPNDELKAYIRHSALMYAVRKFLMDHLAILGKSA